MPDLTPSPARSDPGATETGSWPGRDPSLTVTEPYERAMQTTDLMVEKSTVKLRNCREAYFQGIERVSVASKLPEPVDGEQALRDAPISRATLSFLVPSPAFPGRLRR